MPTESFRVQVVGPLASAHVLWRSRGQLQVSVIAKATFTLVPGGTMTVVPPSPIIAGDVFHHDDSAHSVRVATDLVPYLARTDVLFSGMAHAAGGPTEQLDVRLQLLRDDHPLVDRQLRVLGDDDGAGRRPFEVMSLTYERAYGGIGSTDNPLGTGNGPSKRRPNLISLADPERTACFAPVSRAFPVRAGLLPDGVAPALLDPLSSEVVEVPEGFDWAYFQSAPPDQQTSHLRGDEVVVLEGLHPTLPRVESRLPGVCVLGRVAGVRDGEETWLPLTMRADTLFLDGALQRATLAWRGTVPLPDPTRLAHLRVQLLSSRAAVTAWWPDWDDDENSTHGAGPRSSSGTATRHLTPAPIVERRTPGAGDTLVLDSEVQRENRALSIAKTQMIVDEPTADEATASALAARGAPTLANEETAELDIAAILDAASVVDLDLDMVLGAPSVVPSTLPVGEPTAAPPTERSNVEGARAIPVIAVGPIASTTVAWRWEGRPDFYRTVVFKLVADLVHGGEALLRDEPPAVRASEEEVGEEGRLVVRFPGDLAPVKPRADVVLIGHAHTPEAHKTAARGEVRFAFGRGASPASRKEQPGVSFDRRVRVFGDRVWRDIVGELLPGQPDPFDAMPLSWERAYGGPGHDANPVGIGFTPRGTQPTRMPNLETPERPIVHPRDKVKAVCFAPIPSWWPARASLHGRSDDAYQHAPPQQQLDEVHGDEAFVLEGAHANLRRVEGTLPGERVAAYRLDAKDQLLPIPLRLDAVTFDGDELAVELTFRGVVEVSGPDAPEIVALFARLEAVDAEPATPESVRAAFDEARAAAEGS